MTKEILIPVFIRRIAQRIRSIWEYSCKNHWK